jgi:hypothetical protein
MLMSQQPVLGIIVKVLVFGHIVVWIFGQSFDFKLNYAFTFFIDFRLIVKFTLFGQILNLFCLQPLLMVVFAVLHEAILGLLVAKI